MQNVSLFIFQLSRLMVHRVHVPRDSFDIKFSMLRNPLKTEYQTIKQTIEQDETMAAMRASVVY